MQDGKTATTVLARGLICEGKYEGSKFRRWEAKDKKDATRIRVYRTLVHRFTWQSPDGSDEIALVSEWLPESSGANNLKDCNVQLARGSVYAISIRSLREEMGMICIESNGFTFLGKSAATAAP